MWRFRIVLSQVSTRNDLCRRSPAFQILTMSSSTFAEDRRCTATLDTIGKEDIATWYDIWAAVAAIDDMCMRFGRVGRAVEIGKWSRCLGNTL